MTTTDHWAESIRIIRNRQRRKDMERIKNAAVFYGIVAAPFILSAYVIRKSFKK